MIGSQPGWRLKEYPNLSDSFTDRKERLLERSGTEERAVIFSSFEVHYGILVSWPSCLKRVLTLVPELGAREALRKGYILSGFSCQHVEVRRGARMKRSTVLQSPCLTNDLISVNPPVRTQARLQPRDKDGGRSLACCTSICAEVNLLPCSPLTLCQVLDYSKFHTE